MTERTREHTAALAEFVADAPRGAVDDETIAATARVVLDSVAVAVAGSSAAGIDKVLELVSSWGGAEQSRIWVFGDSVPDVWAAFANSAMLHARDYDDTDDAVPLHANAGALPAAWAALDATDEVVDGRGFLEAVAIGLEVAIRVGRAGGPKSRRGWNSTALCAGFGAVAAAARLWRLPAERVADAFGIQLCQTAGTTQTIVEGSLSKRLAPAFMCKDGVLACRLADAGIDGPRQVFEGRFGYYELYQDGSWDPSALTAGLGEEYHSLELTLKPYPCCRLAHPAIDLARQMAELARPEEIERVEFVGSHLMADMVGRPYRPGSHAQVDAQFSVPYTAAVALHRGDVTIDDFEPPALADPDIARYARERIVVEADPDLPATSVVPVRARLVLRSGEVKELRRDAVRGGVEAPLDDDDMRRKVEDCVAHAARPVDPDALVETLLELPSAANAKRAADVFARVPGYAAQR